MINSETTTTRPSSGVSSGSGSSATRENVLLPQRSYESSTTTTKTSSSSSTTTTFLLLPKSSHSAIAGYVAGFSGTVVGYPLDSAKVWLQTGGCKNKHMILATGNSNRSTLLSPPRQQQPPPPSQVLFQVGTRVCQTLRALYSGVSGPLVTVGMVQSINFAIYDTTRQVLYRWEEEEEQERHQKGGDNTHRTKSSPSLYLTHDSLAGVATAGFLAGMTTAFMTAPLIMIKTNQQVTGNSFRQAVSETLFVRGRVRLSGCTAGFLPHVVGESVGRSLYYVTYELLKRSWGNFKANGYRYDDGAAVVSWIGDSSCNTTSISLQERMVCAAMSGIFCWATIFPLDSLRSRMYAAVAEQQQQHQPSLRRTLLIDTIRTMQRERSFYRGFWVTVLRAGPVAAAVLPVYDLTLETLSSHCPQ